MVTRAWQEASPDEISLYYRTRFEVAEGRYDRMKGLVRAALCKVQLIEEENRKLRAATALAGFGLEPLHFNTLLSTLMTGRMIEEADDSTARLVLELERVKRANQELSAHNRLLREAGAVITTTDDADMQKQYVQAIAEAKEFRPLIAALRARIMGMEFEWTQAHTLRDELFDVDAKVLELQATLQTMGLRHEPASGARVFAVSHRHMLEVLVHHRNRNINGSLAMQATALEQTMMRKDAEILELRKRLRGLELATGVCHAEETVWLPELECRLVEVESRLQVITEDVRAKETKAEELASMVLRFEDRAAEWEAAHAEATSVIAKAERMRAEYNGMVQGIRAEEAKLMRRVKAVNAEALHGNMCAMMAEIDQAEGDIAAKEVELANLRRQRMAMERMVGAEMAAITKLGKK